MDETNVNSSIFQWKTLDVFGRENASSAQRIKRVENARKGSYTKRRKLQWHEKYRDVQVWLGSEWQDWDDVSKDGNLQPEVSIQQVSCLELLACIFSSSHSLAYCKLSFVRGDLISRLLYQVLIRDILCS